MINWETFLVGVLGAVSGVVAGAGPFILSALKQRAELRKGLRADAIAEWKAIVDRQQEDIKLMQVDIREQNKRVVELTKLEADCREKAAKQDGVIQMLTADVRRLQVVVKDGHPAVSTPALVTATAEDGVVRVASPALGPLLGWLPYEIVGRRIDVLVPNDMKEKHNAALKEIVEGKRVVDQAKALFVDALHRNGHRVPVVVNVIQWTSPKGSVILNAEIRPYVKLEEGGR